MKLPYIHMRLKKPDFLISKASRAFKQNKIINVWGLDIGGEALKAVRIVQTIDGMCIDDVDIIDYKAIPHDVTFLQSTGIQEAIQTFLTRHTITKNDKIVVSIPGQFVLSRFITVPPVDKKQLKNIVSYEARQQIPFDLKDIVWDFQQLSEQLPDAEGIEIGLFASKRTTVDHIVTNISPLKPYLGALQVSPLAIANFVLFDQQVDGPTIIVNGEAENTDIIIVDNQHLWLRSIPIFTVDASLMKEIQRSMEYYKSLTKEDVLFKNLLLMGNKFKDPAAVKYITDNFIHEVKFLKTLNILKVSQKIPPACLDENLSNFGIALGLALQGMGFGSLRINLLPQEYAKELEISRKKPYAVAALGCLALAIIIQYAGSRMQIAHLRKSNDYHQKILNKVEDFEKNYKNLETLAQTNKSLLDLVSSVDSSRFFWMEATDKLLSVIPGNVSVISIQSSWIDADALKYITESARGAETARQQTSAAFFQAKKPSALVKAGVSKKALLMGIKGESREPSKSFIEEHVLKPIQNLSLFDQKVPAFKNVEIVPGSCRQVDKEGIGSYICFEIRWIVKSSDEIQQETKS